MPRPRVSLILPCFNETIHIERSLPCIRDYLHHVFGPSGYEIILVDDGSSDNTASYLQRLSGSEYRVIINEKNLGRGAAVKQGLRVATGNVCGYMDIDREVTEVYIPQFVEAVEGGADLATGSRHYNMSFSYHFLLRFMLSRGYRLFSRLFFRGDFTDTEAGYKFFSPRFREAILSLSKFNCWFFDTELVQICLRLKFRYLEIPVLFSWDSKKVSTVKPLRDSLRYVRAALLFRWMIKNNQYKFSSQPVMNTSRVKPVKTANERVA